MGQNCARRDPTDSNTLGSVRQCSNVNDRLCTNFFLFIFHKHTIEQQVPYCYGRTESTKRVYSMKLKLFLITLLTVASTAKAGFLYEEKYNSNSGLYEYEVKTRGKRASQGIFGEYLSFKCETDKRSYNRISMTVSSIMGHGIAGRNKRLRPMLQIDNTRPIGLYGDTPGALSTRVVVHDMERKQELLNELKRGNSAIVTFYNSSNHPHIKSIFKLAGSTKAINYITQKCNNRY